ncbi:hypothetical protein LINPERHAP1_LOCUS36396, partial [Linum perenne]
IRSRWRNLCRHSGGIVFSGRIQRRLTSLPYCGCRRVVLPMWGRPTKDEQEGNPKIHDMAIPVLARGGGRCAWLVSRVEVQVFRSGSEQLPAGAMR